MIVDLLADLVNRRFSIIWFSPIQGLHIDWGCFKFVRCSFFKIGCFIFHLVALTVMKQITSLDCEGCKMEGREPH